MATWGELEAHFTWDDLKSFSWDEVMILKLNQLMYLKKVEVSENTQKKIDQLEYELSKNKELLSQQVCSDKKSSTNTHEKIDSALSTTLLVLEILSKIPEDPPTEIRIQAERIEVCVVNATESLCKDNYDYLKESQCECCQDDSEDDSVNP